MRTMMMAAALALSACATTANGTDKPRVVLETDAGRMVVELELERAPLTVCNFLSYVTDGDYDGGTFFRTVVSETNANPNPIDVIQAATPRGADDADDDDGGGAHALRLCDHGERRRQAARGAGNRRRPDGRRAGA